MSKKSTSDQTDTSRRAFIKTVGAASGVAAVMAVSGEAVADTAVAEKEEVKGSQGYRETDHVREYYKSARI